ncbi:MULTISPECIES: lytic transglycosylase domain-containing protein [Deefgea]|uniref:Transglycosylase SLT domain-containing protein n=1 Tax=Deefgea chitinilytica TaxID=570276 RepID=A0ABS2C7K9_9NEIS|nr:MULTISPECIES: lytic transglycosylase domain-containing protein [Deefgea]MBM5570152.1 transglycosylase SLT domain-containing protein [Deefgea chitinilytica]MBM9887381.1 transglycosylase SLT domain-containing protein [Deefgea sp. CFH1-16]
MLTMLFSATLTLSTTAISPDYAAQWPTQLANAAKQEAHNPWTAAVLYCQAARQGVTEAQYRLAMLYAFGLGVPEDRVAAATLFSVAAEQGHYEAQKMLETIRISAHRLPACVESNTDPARAQLPPPPDIKLMNANQKMVAKIISKVASWHGVDPHFALTIAKVESGLNATAVSPKSAMGVMQLIPDTAERFNVKDVFNVSQNVKGGVRYLRWLLDRYQGNVALVAASYNAGEGKVDRYRGIPPYPETRQYVKRVMALYPYAVHQTEGDRYRDINVFPEQQATKKKNP